MQNVIVRSAGRHRQPGGDWEEIEITTTGTLYEKESSLYLLYEEVLGDDGTEGSICKNRLKIRQDPLEVTIVKSGAVASCLTFSEHGRDVSDYATPYGNLNLDIETKFIHFEQIEEMPVKLEIHYTMQMNYGYVTESRIMIEARPNHF